MRIRWLIGLALLLSCSPRVARVPGPAPLRLPPVPRILAIGDLHGDLTATRRALRLAGAIDERDRWIGGDLVVVQTGDQLDRGDEEQAILDLFEHLSREAAEDGGAVHVLNGNHELKNVRVDVRYVTLDGFADFLDGAAPGLSGAEPATVVAAVLARIKAFAPGGGQHQEATRERARGSALPLRRPCGAVRGDPGRSAVVRGGPHARHGLRDREKDPPGGGA